VESVSIAVVSLDLLTDRLKKCLPLVGGQEVERARKRMEQYVRIAGESLRKSSPNSSHALYHFRAVTPLFRVPAQ